eukprot:1348504-Pyramimonas_sp.AAC.1
MNAAVAGLRGLSDGQKSLVFLRGWCFTRTHPRVLTGCAQTQSFVEMHANLVREMSGASARAVFNA